MTEILFERKTSEIELVEKSKKVLLDNGIIVLPTDTVPGIGCNALSIESVKTLFALKNRPFDLPIPVVVGSIEEVESYSKNLPPIFYTIAERFWPGAITIIVQSNGIITPLVGGNKETLGFRIPDSPLLLSILKAAKCPLALTSANPHGIEPSALHTKLLKWWRHRVDLIILGKSTASQPPSTVIDITKEPPQILRHGPIDHSLIDEILDSGLKS